MKNQYKNELMLASPAKFFISVIDSYISNNKEEDQGIEINTQDLLYQPPANDKEQIARISLIINAVKGYNNLSAEDIVKNLPSKHKVKRAALNAYIYKTIKNPPSRDFVLALFKALSIPEESFSLGLEICGYSRLPENSNFAQDLVLDIASGKNKSLTAEQIDNIAKKITSLTGFLIEEEINGQSK